MVIIGNVWDRTTGFIADHARAIVPIALFAILLPTTVGNVIWGAAQGCDGAVAPMVGVIVTVAMSLVTLWAQLALTALVVTPDEHAARAATRGMGRAVVAMLVLLVVMAVAATPAALGMLASGGTVVHGACTAGVAVFGHNPAIVLYGVVLILAAVFVAIRLTMLYPVIVAEKRALPAIPRAFLLSRGIVWKLTGVWLLFVVTNGVVGMAVTSAFGVLFALVAPDAGPFGVTTILLALIRAGVQTAFTLIVATFAAQLYLAATATRREVPIT